MKTLAEITITPHVLSLNGIELSDNHGGLTSLYRQFADPYPKFFKMDGLCKLGILAAEILLKDIEESEKENMAVVVFSHAGCLANDRAYQGTVRDKERYFPSPAVFVYTLANIVTGEIAIRHKVYGETSCYVLNDRDEDTIARIIGSTWTTSNPSAILAGWIDYENENEYYAELKLITK